MSVPVYDRVKESTTSGGTGPVTLLGAAIGYRRFSDTVGVGNVTYYGISDPFTGDWEVGLGTLVDATTLTRDTVLSSSHGGLPVTFGQKPKSVFLDTPAADRVTRPMLSRTFVQEVASDVWVVRHNLGRDVGVTIKDTAGSEIDGDVVHIDVNSVQVSFSAPFSGTATCR